MILTDRYRFIYGDEWYAERTKDETLRVHPESIARVSILLFTKHSEG